MAATETRLLLLGAVSIFEPVNGYQLRRELLSWNVDDWAHIQPGSIYSGLATLARQGHVLRHRVRDRRRTVAVYEMTDSGRDEFDRLWTVAVETVDLLAPLAFHTALTLMPLIDRSRAITHLRARLAGLEARERESKGWVQDTAHIPPNIVAISQYWRQLGETEHTWLAGLVERIEAGDLSFAGEPATWMPVEDDPGWQMAADRRRYRELLGD